MAVELSEDSLENVAVPCRRLTRPLKSDTTLSDPYSSFSFRARSLSWFTFACVAALVNFPSSTPNVLSTRTLRKNRSS